MTEWPECSYYEKLLYPKHMLELQAVTYLTKPVNKRKMIETLHARSQSQVTMKQFLKGCNICFPFWPVPIESITAPRNRKGSSPSQRWPFLPYIILSPSPSMRKFYAVKREWALPGDLSEPSEQKRARAFLRQSPQDEWKMLLLECSRKILSKETWFVLCFAEAVFMLLRGESFVTKSWLHVFDQLFWDDALSPLEQYDCRQRFTSLIFLPASSD